MFELKSTEYNSLIINLRSQIASSNERGGRRHMPYAFKLLERDNEDNLEAINDLSEDVASPSMTWWPDSPGWLNHHYARHNW